MTKYRFKRKIDHLLSGNLLKFSKRQRFVLTTVILTVGLITTQLLPSNKSFFAIAFLAFATFLFSVWCLWEELDGVEYITLLLPPVFFTVGLGLFYFLLPLRWVTRLPVASLFAVGIYALLLTENIYNVAAIRTIALLRAARAVSLLFSLITFFFLLNTLFSFHFSSLANFVLVESIAFLILLPSFWGERLTPNIEREIFTLSVIFSLIIAEIAFILSFWPLRATFESLYLVSICYTFISIVQNRLKEMPIRKTIWEYVVLNLLAIGMLIKTANWTI